MSDRKLTAKKLLDTPAIDAILAKPSDKRNLVEEAILGDWGKWAGGTSLDCIEHVRKCEDAALMTSRRWNSDCVCDVCWSRSWEPCEKDTPNAVEDKTTGGWMICGFCNEVEIANNLRNELERYKAFYELYAHTPPLATTVETLKDIANHLIAENNRMNSVFKQLQRMNPTCSDVDDLYAAIAEYGLSGGWIDKCGATHTELPQKENFGLGD